RWPSAATAPDTRTPQAPCTPADAAADDSVGSRPPGYSPASARSTRPGVCAQAHLRALAPPPLLPADAAAAAPQSPPTRSDTHEPSPADRCVPGTQSPPAGSSDLHPLSDTADCPKARTDWRQ